MTVRFVNYRLAFYVAIFLLSATVLGLSGNFASLFLPNLHRDFTIFSLVVASLTIFVFFLTVQWAVPWIEAISAFILGALWLAMGAWSTDVIGNVQCDTLQGQRTATKNGEMSAQAYCYEMKVTQAFSWMLFVLFIIYLIILISLVSQAQKFGRYSIWSEPIRELGWFGEWPGYYNTHHGTPMQQQHQPMMMYGYPGVAPGPLPQPGPGQSIVIQPGINGQPPTIQTMPLSTV